MRIFKGFSIGLVILLAMAGAAHSGVAQTAKPQSDKGALRIYFVDVEGGQSTLFVAPSGESMLVDTGSPGFAVASMISSCSSAAESIRTNLRA